MSTHILDSAATFSRGFCIGYFLDQLMYSKRREEKPFPALLQTIHLNLALNQACAVFAHYKTFFSARALNRSRIAFFTIPLALTLFSRDSFSPIVNKISVFCQRHLDTLSLTVSLTSTMALFVFGQTAYASTTLAVIVVSEITRRGWLPKLCLGIISHMGFVLAHGLGVVYGDAFTKFFSAAELASAAFSKCFAIIKPQGNQSASSMRAVGRPVSITQLPSLADDSADANLEVNRTHIHEPLTKPSASATVEEKLRYHFLVILSKERKSLWDCIYAKLMRKSKFLYELSKFYKSIGIPLEEMLIEAGGFREVLGLSDGRHQTKKMEFTNYIFKQFVPTELLNDISDMFWEGRTNFRGYTVPPMVETITEGIKSSETLKVAVKAWWKHWLERQTFPEQDKSALLQNYTTNNLVMGEPLEENGEIKPKFVRAMLIEMGILTTF